MTERDRFGWPVRRVGGHRLCARPSCKSEEFRIDGYCSCECRGEHEHEEEIASLIALLRKCEECFSGHMIGINCHGPVLDAETAAELRAVLEGKNR